ncbi:MAG: AbrB/MazE/SpoVT family DNA-binding domain-containing protein [Defluviitaleaceae bacterium]|nr:AbrB/MazE/SpoVT family DNA-binding domain-containing protein [Defluviitaleaceae bacterium]
MERYSSRTIDDVGRLVLHSELRQALGLLAEDKIFLRRVNTIVILQKATSNLDSDCFAAQVSELGAIELPAELRKQMGWKAKTKVAVYHTDNILIMKSSEKK